MRWTTSEAVRYFMNLRFSFDEALIAQGERAPLQGGEGGNADEFSRRRCGLSGISRLRRGIWAAAFTAFLSAARCVAPFIIPPSLRHYRIILFYPRIFSSFHDPSSSPRLFRNSIPVPPSPSYASALPSLNISLDRGYF